MKNKRVAVLCQAAAVPAIGGQRKPMKPGGYSDSGADIAFALKTLDIEVLTPQPDPDPRVDTDWVFPDTEAGIESAQALGANVLWANTVLFNGHPLQKTASADVSVVGQSPSIVHRFDDKWYTNRLLRSRGLNVARSVLVGHAAAPANDIIDTSSLTAQNLRRRGLALPLVVKPRRGRGSDGVTRVRTLPELQSAVAGLLSARTVEDGESHAKYGELVILEEFLPGKEITLTVMPPGGYGLRGAEVSKSNYWAMPVVERFNHRDGIAPYSGVVAVTGNSALLRTGTECDDHLARLVRECERAAEFIRGKAAIRIDCRATAQGDFRLFDVNMKPNMTGPGRPGRDRQDSLSCIAARAIGWEYKDLIFNMLRQSWPSTSMECATDSGPDETAARTTGGGRHDR